MQWWYLHIEQISISQRMTEVRYGRAVKTDLYKFKSGFTNKSSHSPLHTRLLLKLKVTLFDLFLNLICHPAKQR